MNIYEAVGGEATFLALTDAFYDRVAADPLLRPLFPANMEPGKRRLAYFLIESLGGPPRWSHERHFGHLLNANHRREPAMAARVDHLERRSGAEPPPATPSAHYGSRVAPRRDGKRWTMDD